MYSGFSLATETQLYYMHTYQSLFLEIIRKTRNTGMEIGNVCGLARDSFNRIIFLPNQHDSKTKTASIVSVNKDIGVTLLVSAIEKRVPQEDETQIHQSTIGQDQFCDRQPSTRSGWHTEEKGWHSLGDYAPGHITKQPPPLFLLILLFLYTCLPWSNNFLILLLQVLPSVIVLSRKYLRMC